MFENNKNFYPTPLPLIHKMLSDIDFREVGTILEPSAGNGAIVDEILNRMKQTQRNSYNREEKKYDIDTIELDQNLRYILKGKGFRVVYDDFLTYDSFKRYNLIVMNPPFENGDKHLLKSLEMQSTGGKIVCILNAETLKNPCSNSRKDLVSKLKEYNASIEYLQEEFTEADRRTDVEIALIKVTIPNTNRKSIIIDKLKQEEQFEKSQNSYNSNSLIASDFIKGIIQQYQFELKAGLDLINEYENLQPLILKSFKKDNYSNSILNLSVDGAKYDKSDDTLENAYIKKIRYKYWETLFGNEQFTSLLTSNLLWEYREKVTDLQDYDFSYYNIKELQLQMSKNVVKGVEDTILKLFEEFSHKYDWRDETSKNIHYFNGWKTNDSFKINSRVVIPLNSYNSICGNLDYSYKFYEKLKDIEHIFDYLDGGLTESIDLRNILNTAEKEGQTKNITTKYFNINTFKKGTTHITFLNEELLKKFNLLGCQHRGWLPPTYGKVKYEDMTKEEQDTINEYEGEESYNKVMSNLDYYIYNPSKVLMLNA